MVVISIGKVPVSYVDRLTQWIWKNLKIRESEQEHLCYDFLVRAK